MRPVALREGRGGSAQERALEVRAEAIAKIVAQAPDQVVADTEPRAAELHAARALKVEELSDGKDVVVRVRGALDRTGTCSSRTSALR